MLDDGGEVDLDLGNYERFLDVTLHRDNNITTGKIYKQVIEKEREGSYLGKTVQGKSFSSEFLFLPTPDHHHQLFLKWCHTSPMQFKNGSNGSLNSLLKEISSRKFASSSWEAQLAILKGCLLSRLFGSFNSESR